MWNTAQCQQRASGARACICTQHVRATRASPFRFTRTLRMPYTLPAATSKNSRGRSSASLPSLHASLATRARRRARFESMSEFPDAPAIALRGQADSRSKSTGIANMEFYVSLEAHLGHSPHQHSCEHRTCRNRRPHATTRGFFVRNRKSLRRTLCLSRST